MKSFKKLLFGIFVLANTAAIATHASDNENTGSYPVLETGLFGREKNKNQNNNADKKCNDLDRNCCNNSTSFKLCPQA